MTDLIISIDLGTTRLKVAAFSVDGTLHEQRHRRHREHGVGNGDAQDPNEWWRDTVDLVKEVRTALAERMGGTEVLGLSLSGRGGAAVFADVDGDVLVPPWSDDRHGKERARLARAYGSRLAPYTQAMLAKILWLQAHAPESFRRARYAFYAKDFLLYRLTGRHCTDWSSGPDGPTWPEEVLAHLKLHQSLLPKPALPWAIAGGLTSAAARLLELPAGTPVAVGAHDGVCANVGAGACRPGDYAITLGTHAVVRAVTESASIGSYRFYCLPEHCQVVGGNVLLGGRAADWFLDLVDAGSTDRDATFARLDAAAAAVPPGADGVRFLPHLAGQTAPRRRPRARGVLAGLCVHHGPAEGHRAVLEGVAFAVASVLREVVGWCGEPERIRVTGGGARSRLWVEIIAATLNRPLELTDQAAEGRGAAMFLARGLGCYPDHDAAADAMARVSMRIEPDPELCRRYARVAEDWARLNAAVRSYGRQPEA